MQHDLIPEASPRPNVRPSIPARAGAIGKALLVYLGTGSIGLALLAFLVFKGAGC